MPTLMGHKGASLVRDIEAFLIAGKSRGYVTRDELNNVLPGKLTAEEIDWAVERLSALGIELVDAQRHEQYKFQSTFSAADGPSAIVNGISAYVPPRHASRVAQRFLMLVF